MIGEPVGKEALGLLKALLEAWDEPHRGDLDQAREVMFEPIERARAFLDKVQQD
jgi:hypothetical protein